MKVKPGIKAKLMVSYAFVAMFSITTLAGVANVFPENRFTAFVESRIGGEKQDILETLAASWDSHQGWDHDELSSIGMAVLERGFLIRINAEDGSEVWDARTHNHGLCQEMILNLSATMDQRYKGWSGNYTEDSHQLHGTVAIGYYGPFWFTSAEVFFLESLNSIILATAGLILALALILGYLMARGIAKPLEALNNTAKHLQTRPVQAITLASSGTKEIDVLGTTLQSLASDLARQESLRQRMVADISHELRTPLTTIRGQVEAMIDGIWPRSTEHLGGILEEIERLTRLVGQIEGLATIDAATSPVKKQELDLASFTQTLAQGHHQLFAHRGIEFASTIQNPAHISTDPDKLTQIMVNLLTNAARYTKPGGKVTLSCHGSTLQVSDTGCGIPPEDLPHIFQRFYRVDPSRSSANGGAGIGLTIAESLAQSLGSTIQAESTPGAGSRFWIQLGSDPTGPH